MKFFFLFFCRERGGVHYLRNGRTDMVSVASGGEGMSFT